MEITDAEFAGATGAIFSPCGAYRYVLWRRFLTGRGRCLFLMLNPSTADASRNDPTVERCERRARRDGYGELFVANIFAFRATDPDDMKRAADPVGPLNDGWILKLAESSAVIVCGWGEHGAFRGRSYAVRTLLARFTLYALAVNKSGEPKHPLYCGYDRVPIRYDD